MNRGANCACTKFQDWTFLTFRHESPIRRKQASTAPEESHNTNVTDTLIFIRQPERTTAEPIVLKGLRAERPSRDEDQKFDDLVCKTESVEPDYQRTKHNVSIIETMSLGHGIDKTYEVRRRFGAWPSIGIWSAV